MSVIAVVLLVVIPGLVCVPVDIREKELEGRNPVVITAESALLSILRMDTKKCVLKLVCDLGANYSMYDSFAHKLVSHWGHSVAPFDFSVLDQPGFVEMFGSGSEEIIDAVNLKKLDEKAATELVSRNSPNDALTGRHCSKFNKQMIYIKNQDGYFKTVSWWRVQPTTTSRPSIVKELHKHHKHHEKPEKEILQTTTTSRPITSTDAPETQTKQHGKPEKDHHNHTKKAVSAHGEKDIPVVSTEKNSSFVPGGEDFAKIFKMIKELSEKLLNRGNVEEPATVELDEKASSDRIDVLAGTSEPELVNSTTEQNIDLTDSDNSTTTEELKTNEDTMLVDIGTVPANVSSENGTESNSTTTMDPETTEDDLVMVIGHELANVSLENATASNSTTTEDSGRDQLDLEARSEASMYPGAFVFNRAFALGLFSGPAACMQTFSACYMDTNQIMEFGEMLMTNIQADNLDATRD